MDEVGQQNNENSYDYLLSRATLQTQPKRKEVVAVERRRSRGWGGEALRLKGSSRVIIIIIIVLPKRWLAMDSRYIHVEGSLGGNQIAIDEGVLQEYTRENGLEGRIKS